MIYYEEIISKLKSLSNPKNISGMARFGINPKYALGINIPVLRKLAREIKKNPSFAKATEDLHQLAQELWNSEIHEARILAGMIDVPELVTDAQIDSWIKDFNSWDLCDQTCLNLFAKLAEQSPSEVPIKSGRRRKDIPNAYDKVAEWVHLESEFERRAGFALLAVLAWHDKTATDRKLLEFFPIIKKYSTDERNFVRKAVNWSLRQIGKRNPNLKKEAIKLAREIEKINNKTARWIARDALKELQFTT